jgi:hypothetical protein
MQYFVYDTGARAVIDSRGKVSKDLFTVLLCELAIGSAQFELNLLRIDTPERSLARRPDVNANFVLGVRTTPGRSAPPACRR